jgi:hypothetical protein
MSVTFSDEGHKYHPSMAVVKVSGRGDNVVGIKLSTCYGEAAMR